MTSSPPAARPEANGHASAPDSMELDRLAADYAQLQAQVDALELRIHRDEQRRKALLHLITDFDSTNRQLANQRKAMLHILVDYEHDRRRVVQQQEQLVQSAKLATLGELTTGVAHELNNPLNNIGLFVGNVIDLISLGAHDDERVLSDLKKAMDQVHKASQIITHLRTFGRAAPTSREPVRVNAIIVQALSLLHEQLRLRDIDVALELDASDPLVMANSIQLEQVFLNLLTNARDAVASIEHKQIQIRSSVDAETVTIVFQDSGPGIPPELQPRVFDPFFTTKEVGEGTGLGLSITYGIMRDHGGTIQVDGSTRHGAAFVLELPMTPGAAAKT